MEILPLEPAPSIPENPEPEPVPEEVPEPANEAPQEPPPADQGEHQVDTFA